MSRSTYPPEFRRSLQKDIERMMKKPERLTPELLQQYTVDLENVFSESELLQFGYDCSRQFGFYLFFHTETPNKAISVGLKRERQEEELRLHEDEKELFRSLARAIREKANELGVAVIMPRT